MSRRGPHKETYADYAARVGNLPTGAMAAGKMPDGDYGRALAWAEYLKISLCPHRLPSCEKCPACPGRQALHRLEEEHEGPKEVPLYPVLGLGPHLGNRG